MNTQSFYPTMYYRHEGASKNRTVRFGQPGFRFRGNMNLIYGFSVTKDDVITIGWMRALAQAVSEGIARFFRSSLHQRILHPADGSFFGGTAHCEALPDFESFSTCFATIRFPICAPIHAVTITPASSTIQPHD